MAQRTPNVQPSVRATALVETCWMPVIRIVRDATKTGGGDENIGFVIGKPSVSGKRKGIETRERRVEIGKTAQLEPAPAREADEGAAIDFDEERASGGRRIERPHRHAARQMVEQAHSREARLRDLRRADRIEDRGGLAAARRIERGLAFAKVHEVRLCTVRLAEVEMSPEAAFEEGCGAEVFILAGGVHESPERARFIWRAISRKIGAARDERRREAEIHAHERRRSISKRRDPVQHLRARPDMAGLHQTRRRIARLGDRNRDAFVAAALGAGPVDRGKARETALQARISTSAYSAGMRQSPRCRSACRRDPRRGARSRCCGSARSR